MTSTFPTPTNAVRMPESVSVLGIPVTPITMIGTVLSIRRLVAAGRPSFVISANLNYAMLAAQDPAIAEVTRRAAFVVADGMPLVWAAKKLGTPLPERVAGADLLFRLAREAARLGWRVHFIGGAEGVAEEAADRLIDRYPKLNVVGVEVPPFGPQTPAENAAMIARIRASRPDLLIGAFSQPAGEKWMAANVGQIGVPCGIQLGAALDFAAGRVRRAPGWIGRSGLEWAFRLAQEPRRLAGRYARNARFLARELLSTSPSPVNR